MDDVVRHEGSHRPIGFAGAFVRQLGLLWSTRRPILLAIGLLGVMGIAGEPWTDSPMTRLLTPWPLWLVLVGPIWALAVWHNEGPAARHYFWAQPVDRFTHTMARVAAGAAWLWILYALLVLAAVIIGITDGEAGQLGMITARGWVNFFTAPLLGYLMLSALGVATDHPIRWAFAILFILPFLLSLLTEWLGLHRFVDTLLTPLTHQQWGLGLTLIGAFGEAVSVVEHTVRGMSDGPRLFITATWWAATALWLAFWAGLVALLASRHPDTFPRWRRGARTPG